MPRSSRDPKVQELVDILSDMDSEQSTEDIRRICRQIRKIDGTNLLYSRIRPLADKHYSHWLKAYEKAIVSKDSEECDHCRDECDKWLKISRTICDVLEKWIAGPTQ